MKPIAPNTLIQNRYLIVHLIGKGGMGEVYLAVDQRLGSAVALKRTFFSDDEMLGSAFEREARTLARLRHSVLTKVSDHFIEDETQYLVMEHIAGDDLAKRLEANKKPFPLSWVLFWADQLLDALNYLHTHEPPIVHRDIKPQNLKLTAENNIVLLDFGLSKNNIGQSQIVRSGSTGSVVGYTPHYAPMEQIRGTGTDGRSDIFSLSATLYQLLTTAVPADALTRADAVLSGMSDPIQPLNELNPKVSKEISDIILRGMSLSQDQRFATAREMQAALREAYTRMKKQAPAQAAENNHNQAEIPQSQLVTQVISVSPAISAPVQTEAQQFNSAPNSFPVSSKQNSYSTQVQDYQNGEQDFNPTVHNNNDQEDFDLKQSSVKTEVFNFGSSEAFFEAQKENFATPKVVSENEQFGNKQSFADIEDFTPENDFGTPEKDFAADENFSPDATVPLIAYENQNGRETSPPSDATFDSFSSNEEHQSQTSNNSPDELYYQNESAVSKPVNTVPKAQSSGKTLMIAGGLGAFFILFLGALGIGWYVLSSSKTVTESPMPAPQETQEKIEVVPTPEPTLEAIIETNTNTSIEENTANTNTNSDTEIVQETKDNKTDKPQTVQNLPAKTATPKPGQQTVTVKTPPKVAEKVPTPAPKKTPAKSDRTDILQ